MRSKSALDRNSLAISPGTPIVVTQSRAPKPPLPLLPRVGIKLALDGLPLGGFELLNGAFGLFCQGQLSPLYGALVV